jgi:predicted amidohydrolase
LRVALAQINSTVGDFDGNMTRILTEIERSRSGGAEIVVFPELAVFGYPPKDLVLRQDLVERNMAAVEGIASQCTDIAAIVGCVRTDGTRQGKGKVNAAVYCCQGEVRAVYAKTLLPSYDVFDETRYFSPGADAGIVSLPAGSAPKQAGLTICEDLWNDRQFEGRRVYGVDPVEHAVAAGAELLINLSASPYRAGIQEQREALFSEQIRQHAVPLVLVNQVGGNDDLIFDGASLVLDSTGNVVARAKPFEEDLLFVTLPTCAGARVEAYPDRLESIRQALVVGIRDYIRKCGFQTVVVGLSGGVDSAVTAVLAVEAIGPGRVQGVAMPSRFSSTHSVEDARCLAEQLGIEFTVIPIEGAHRAMEEAVAPSFARYRADEATTAEENIQARIRGGILMALSRAERRAQDHRVRTGPPCQRVRHARADSTTNDYPSAVGRTP